MIRSRDTQFEKEILNSDNRINKCFIRGDNLILSHINNKNLFHYLKSSDEIETCDDKINIIRA